MNFRIILFIVLGFFIFNSLTNTHAQRRTVDMADYDNDDTTSRKPNADSLKDVRSNINDSIRIAREHNTDSMREAREHIADSAKTARQHKTDSTQKIRKHITDSTASIRKYRESKHYKDSVAKSRTNKATALKKTRESHMDSLKDARKAMTDSLTASRKNKTDSVKAIQKKRTDSLAKIKKYRSSKRYTDSVSMVRRNHTDSVKESQENFRDSISKARKRSIDSTKTARKKSADSLKAIRTKTMDSLVKVRKARTDSFAKVKKEKEALAKAKEKKKDQDKKLKLEIKMKQKHEKWSNASMLKRRWSPMRRFTQNSFTHYNYYYNANRKMDEALQNMQRSRKENYDSLIGLYPFDPNRDSSMMSSDMDTIVRKISVGIQIHDPRVKWSNDLYLLMGEAYYYRGKYEYAATSFRYIISQDEAARKKELAAKGYGYSGASKDAPTIADDEKKGRLDFLKHKSVHNDAILWLARTYTEGHQVENAESILSLLETDKNLPEDLKGRLAIEKAFAYLSENNDKAASKQLDIAADDSHLPNWLRLRAAFLNGQLLQNMENYKASAASFEKVISYYPKLEMDFYSRKYIATNRLLSGEDVEDAMKPLKKVLNDGKYVTYYDQVYFVMGQLALKAHQTEKAITYLTKSANTPKASKKQKAISYAALGDVYYSTARYPDAKRAYDSASKYSSAAGKDNTVLAAVQRAKGLEEISGPARVIHDQDSLIELSALSKKEQLVAIRRYLRDLEKKMQDSISNAENSGVTAVATADQDENKEGANWYFSNPTLMQQGKADFIKKWGNRPLKDNWRLAPAASGSNGSDDDLSQTGTQKENGLPTEESLLAKIPNTQPQKELSAKIEQRAYIMLAKAYIKQLDDYKAASGTLDTLDIRFPDHNQKEEELYLRYQIAMKADDLAKAKKYSEELLAKFPASQYASLVRPRTSESKPEAMIGGKTVAQYFDETYNLLMMHQYTEALMHVREAKKQYDNPSYQKRFDVVEAMAYAGSSDFNMADSSISKFLKAYPKDTLTPWATEVKQYIKEVRNGGKPSWYNENEFRRKRDSAIAANTKPASPVAAPVKPSAPVVPSNIPPRYTYHVDSPQYCIIVLPGIDSRTSGLKKAVKDVNGGKYAAAGLDLLFDLYTIDQGVLVIRQFANVAVSKAYLQDLLASDVFKGFAPDELKVMLISSENYRKMLTDRDAQPYYNFYSSNY